MRGRIFRQQGSEDWSSIAGERGGLILGDMKVVF